MTVPHVWALEQIQRLPEFGSNKAHGWFYALVADQITDEQGDKQECIVLAEVYPGLGYSLVDRSELDEETWQMIEQDLRRLLPPEIAATERKD